jgi:hypothetical protein
MQTYFTDLMDDAIERRHQTEMDALYGDRNIGPSQPCARCLKCGHGIDLSKHGGKVFHFDPGTETLHVCKPTYRQLMAKIHRDLRREELRDEKPGKGLKVSVLFGKHRPKT